MNSEKENLLTIDIGNTNIHFGVFKGKRLTKIWQTANNNQKRINLILSSIKNPNGIIVSSVVPVVTKTLQKIITKKFDCNLLLLNHKTKTDLVIHYKNPEKLGADRIANIVAGKEYYGFPLIVIDFGTATTFDCISNQGEYIGGLILPGIKMMLNSLHQNTAQLPLINFSKPNKIVGQSTQECILSGTYYCHIGMTEYISSVLKKHLGLKTKVVATGGLAKTIHLSTKSIDYVDSVLTLRGLQTVWNKNTRYIMKK